MKYLLRVMTPGSDEEVMEDFPSDTPFGSVAVGDLLDLPEYRKPGIGPLLRVIKVEHLLSARGEASHYICLFTEEVPDTPETRTARR